MRLYRYYNATLDDWAIFPESELATWTGNGYATESGTNAWIGYVYPNTDTDGDWVINGFEGLIGTNPNAADSDCDSHPRRPGDPQVSLYRPRDRKLLKSVQKPGGFGRRALSFHGASSRWLSPNSCQR